jgi:hypothetical protein
MIAALAMPLCIARNRSVELITETIVVLDPSL